ncbi:Aste57867_9172 [Aphanomyces stellatus]|uniref:Aste57867_9172 protein n=1 Tax=Aphanomyces stellatus TaxID=120398 RepID=A0A485KMC4_9STRA|nr:hypothetical protein As57867_009136 [Aphanomyces stellatus]VFT86056.1 Aste57867_9172 [Aphanomyces stellatus]
MPDDDGAYILLKSPNGTFVRYNLDPTIQHTPLLVSQKDLRPPPPRIPPVFDIFLGVSAYRDGVRCGLTLFTAFSRASHPDRLHVGVVDQVLPDDSTCLDEYCNLATAHWGDCRYKSQIQIDSHDALTSTGPTTARYFQQKMIQNETFCLQVDAHSQFLSNWDTVLVREWTRTNNEMAVLTTYPTKFKRASSSSLAGNRTSYYTGTYAPHLCTHMPRGSVSDLPYATGIVHIHNSKWPQLSAYFGGGLAFSKCHAEKRAPVDKHTKWLFYGEEVLRAYVLWSNGYDFYSPSRQGTVVLHNWTTDANRTLFWKDTPPDVLARKAIQEEQSLNRVRAILKLPFEGAVDFDEMQQFNRGSVRSVEQFLAFYGASNTNVNFDGERCHQLHWVPYVRPEIVQELLHGWSQGASSISAVKKGGDGLVAQLKVQELARQPTQAKLQKLANAAFSFYQVLPAMVVLAGFALCCLSYHTRRHLLAPKYSPVPQSPGSK